MQDSKRDTDVKNKLLDSDGEGEGRVIWENSTETCILSYVKEMTSPSSIHETGHSKLLHWDNSEGWDGEGSVRGVWDRGTHIYPWLIHVNVWQNPPQYCKVISLQLKLIKKIITCWDFYWNCVESINQEREKWLLDSTKSSYLWSWNKYLSIISFLLLQIFAVFLYRSYTYPTKLKPKYFIFPILM